MTGAGSGGQGPPDGSDAEDADKCPICLGVLAGGELAMPDSCCHVFCLRCLLTWAELQMSPSCPVDRRPFRNVYRWDGNLRLVQVPVRKRLTRAEVESCCCGNPEKQVCVKKSARRLRRQKTERKADAKTKGLVRKCNDEDPPSLSRKKVRGTECCTWSPPPSVSLTTSPLDIAEPVWLAADGPYDPELDQCKPQVQRCPWLSPAAPIPADGSWRQRFHETSWNNSPLPLEFTSSPFTSSSPFNPSHFVFQGVVVCAVTRPKGGEKRGGRSSTSKAPTKEQQSLPSRRSGRNSKSQEATPPSDPTSPPQSSLSDSDSSASQSTKLGKSSQVPAKRKGKRVTNRKASGKRKSTRKNQSPEVVSSPAATEEEEEGDGDDSSEKVEQMDDAQEDQDMNFSGQQQTDSEGSFKEKQSEEDAGSLTVGEVIDEDKEQSNDQQQEEGDEGSGDLTTPLDSPPNSPLSCSEDIQSKEEEEEEEEEPTSPLLSDEKDVEKRSSSPPSDSQDTLKEDPTSPQCYKQEEQNDIEICRESEDINNDKPSKEVKTEDEDTAEPASPCPAESPENLDDPEEKTFSDIDVKMPESEEHSQMGGSEDVTSKEDNFTSKDDDDASRNDGSISKDDNDASKDNTDVVPMDCSSPMSEHGNDPLHGNASPAAAEPPALETQALKDDGPKDQQERERSQERKNGKRRSRFHSPTSTWSPKRESKKEPSSRSRSRERDGIQSSGRSSRARSRDRDGDRDGEREHSRRDRSRERRRQRYRSRSRSRTRSRSRSRSRTRSYRRGTSPERRASRERSPQRKERRGGWRSGRGGSSGFEGRRHQGGTGRFENGVPTESSPDRQGWSDNPDWVTEKTRAKPETRSWDSGFSGNSRWEDHNKTGGNGAESHGRGGRGGSERGRGAGWGAGNRSFYNQQDETVENRWQPRNNSGTGNNSGNDAYSRFNESRGGGRKKESEPDSMLDRSGWSSASSWAVRRTLPADVQDYYSKRERGGPGSWNRQEEEQPAAEAAKSEAPPQAVPGNAAVPVMSVIPPQPQMNVLQHHYPMQSMQGPLPVSLQPAAPYAMPPQVPMHLHPAVPLLQVPAVGAQGLPPPPPPPPPMQAGSQTAAAQPDGHATQMANAVMALGKPALLPTPTKAGVLAASHSQPSSTTQSGQHNKAQADSSKKEKKQQIQEQAINEVKTAIKPYYQKKEITKEEYKEIVRKAVEKVCHSKSGEVNSSKVANLVKAYVDKYKHARKK